jgi:4-amino-4-deoxy-L-arabinose transferase-like glycosyltransferase
MRRWGTSDWAALATVLAAAAALRFYALGYGLPQVVYVDSFFYVGEASRMLEPGPYAPESFYYPSGFMDLLAGLYWLSGIDGVYGRHLAARAVSAVFGVLLVALVYALVRREASTRGALTAAVLTAVCPVLVTAARIEATDSMVVFLMTATLALAGGFPQRLGSWLVIGALAGLAAGTKYSGAFVLAFVALAAAIAAWENGRWIRPLGGAVAAATVAVIVFCATTPWLFAHFSEYASWFEVQALVVQNGQIGRVQAGAWDYFVSDTPTWEQPWLGTSYLGNLGPVLFPAALAAWVWAMLGYGGRRRRFEALYVFVFLTLVIGPGRIKAIRYLMPTLPVLFVLVGCAADRLLAARPRWAAPLVLVLLAARPATASTMHVATAGRPSTNELARTWMAANVPAGSRVFISPLFTSDITDMQSFQPVLIQGAGYRQFRLPEGKGPSAERAPMFSPTLFQQMRDNHVQWVVTNSWFNDAFRPVPENLLFFPRAVASYEDFRQRLESAATLRWRVAGWEEGRLGPSIAIYQLE